MKINFNEFEQKALNISIKKELNCNEKSLVSALLEISNQARLSENFLKQIEQVVNTIESF